MYQYFVFIFDPIVGIRCHSTVFFKGFKFCSFKFGIKMSLNESEWKKDKSRSHSICFVLYQVVGGNRGLYGLCKGLLALFETDNKKILEHHNKNCWHENISLLYAVFECDFRLADFWWCTISYKNTHMIGVLMFELFYVRKYYIFCQTL